MTTAVKIFIIANKVIERLSLPELFSGPAQKFVRLACGVTLLNVQPGSGRNTA
jgi:hypothetical protein